jgi:hypothetical protein
MSAPTADDIFAKISLFVFGDDSPQAVRRTRHLLATKRRPSFKLGGIVAARRSKVKRAIGALEAAEGDRQ